MPRKVFIVSLGCPKNLTDAEVMAGRLAAAGFELARDESEADVALINTCAFLKTAAKESEGAIRRLVALKERGGLSKIVVAGCLAERDRNAVLEKFPQIDAVLGINALESAASALNNGPRVVLPPAGPLSSPKLKLRLTAPHSAYLKIADGCDNRCAYCTIPAIRGRFRSKPLEEALREAESLARSGAREISLVAQDTTLYGADLYGRPALYELLKKLVKIRGIKWLRLMYAYPERLSPKIPRLIRDEEKLCRYLDMPLQHISDNILKMMNRRSTGKSIRDKLAEIRKVLPDIALRTTFIAGFPGETDEDFEKLRDFVAEARFDSVAVFKYSRESGTPAAGFPGQVPDRVKTARMNELIDLQSRIVDEKNRALIGATVRVLLDSPVSGRTYRDAPEIDGRVRIIQDARLEREELKAGDFVDVKITGASGYLRRGVIVPARDSQKSVIRKGSRQLFK